MSADTKPLRFAGYAALFGKRDSGLDVIVPGAFASSIAEQAAPLPLLWQHRADLRIGWIEKVEEDTRGLRVLARIDNPAGGAAAALKRGSVTGLSFGYRVREAKNDGIGREISDLRLFEVSLVSHPMQHGARVHLVE
ncbi:HK97 family phage prohead protease [Novosphingobium sp.]|uniref:HK97 family phage prohead protease n=1 Tax=Novosphingobium sp. TaxID=1874826 RepID=UPI00286DBEBD|nr:HK97 family phage prohead protease [Novosphingobium sp.]